MFSSIKEFLYLIPAILIAITAHEFAHGYVSYRLGDPTPKMQGRLTLNPLAHLDPVGALCMIFFRMGWAKPVPINPYFYKDRKKGMILVSLAGPAMNYLLAFISMIFFGIFTHLEMNIGIWFYYMAIMNVGLGTFNLIPIPPLDGSNVLAALVPQIQNFYHKIQRYAMLILFIGLSVGILDRPLAWLNSNVINGMWSVVYRLLSLFLRNGGMI